MRRFIRWQLRGLAALLLTAASAAAQGLTIPAHVIAGGGDTSIGGVYTLTGTIGQAAAGGQLRGDAFFIAGGFWTSPGVGGFTDDPLVAGSSVIRAIHLAELRARIDAVRGRFGLGPYSYSDAVIANVTMIRARNIAETRTALDEAYAAATRGLPSYTTTPGAGVTIRVADIAELRAAVVAIE